MEVVNIFLFLKWLITVSVLTAVLGITIDYFFPIRIIGLTGSVACGKSTVAKQMRRRMRVHVIDFDKLGHKALDAGCTPHAVVREKFGPKICRHDWTINRKVLGNIVFEDKTKLQFLNKAVRTQLIMLFVWELLRGVFWKRRLIIVLDAPLLFESGLNYFCDWTIAVVVKRDAQIARLLSRDGCEMDEALKKIDSQMSSEVKGGLADILIDNNPCVLQLSHRVKSIMQEKPFNQKNRVFLKLSTGKFSVAIALLISILALTFHIPEIFFSIVVGLTIVIIEIFIRVR